MRLINADALGIGKANPDAFEEKAYAWGWNTAIEIIEKAPTVDAVPVVRCEHCKNHRIIGSRIMCARNAVWIDGHEAGLCGTLADHFCGYGERREANHDEKEN